MSRRLSKDFGGNLGQGSKWIRKKKRIMIYERDAWACVWCTADLRHAEGYARTLDHIVPRELGGTNAAENLVTACGDCNVRRGMLPPLAYAATIAESSRSPLAVVADVLGRIANAIHTELPRSAA
jgi:5-methylcytosine-specific restriction endonuclease McrA